MTLHYADDWLTVYAGDCREVLAVMPEESIHTVVTSPPYWGLRDYGISPTVWGGVADHDHDWGKPLSPARRGPGNAPGDLSTSSLTNPERQNNLPRPTSAGALCPCGAWSGTLGLEPTPELYVEHLVEVFRLVRRVLRRDGTVWLNLGDCYATGAGRVGDHPGGGERGAKWSGYRGDNGSHGSPRHREGRSKFSRAARTAERSGHEGKHSYRIGPMTQPNRMPLPGLKPKDLVGMPWRVAFALQADGWWLRSDIVWAKPNPMPESVTDRPTKAHEYVFLLSRAARYFYDAAAVRVEDRGQDHVRSVLDGQASLEPSGGLSGPHRGLRTVAGRNGAGRSLRSVWTIATQPYPDAHFATFPAKLVEPCVMAGSPTGGGSPRSVRRDGDRGHGR